MKKYILLFAMSLFLFASCEEDLTVYDEGEGFVQLATTSSVSFDEVANPVATSVILGASENPNGVTVNFTVTSSDPSRYTVEPASGSLEIPAGEFSADIVITPVDNLLVDGDVDIVLELASGGSAPVGIGGEGIEATTRNLVLVDNDCPTVISNSYGVEVFAFDDEAPSHTVTFVPVPGTDNQWTVTSSWGPQFVAWATGDAGFANRFLYSGTVVLNPDFTVDFIGDDAYATGGSGTYSSCNDQFRITLTQALFTTDFTVEIVMTGQ